MGKKRLFVRVEIRDGVTSWTQYLFRVESRYDDDVVMKDNTVLRQVAYAGSERPLLLLRAGGGRMTVADLVKTVKDYLKATKQTGGVWELFPGEENAQRWVWLRKSDKPAGRRRREARVQARAVAERARRGVALRYLAMQRACRTDRSLMQLGAWVVDGECRVPYATYSAWWIISNGSCHLEKTDPDVGVIGEHREFGDCFLGGNTSFNFRHERDFARRFKRPKQVDTEGPHEWRPYKYPYLYKRVAWKCDDGRELSCYDITGLQQVNASVFDLKSGKILTLKQTRAFGSDITESHRLSDGVESMDFMNGGRFKFRRTEESAV